MQRLLSSISQEYVHLEKVNGSRWKLEVINNGVRYSSIAYIEGFCCQRPR